jgi:protein-S-isoprenylcysteine O-methyltransferase Ste14
MTDADKPSLIVRIPTPLWLIGLVLVALGADALLGMQPVLRHRPTGIALIAVGFGISAWARLTFKLRGAEIFPWSEAHAALVASGPFRFTRNPMYVGLVVMGIGAALVAGTWMMWLVPVVVFVLDELVIIPYEERSMARAFGDAYREYQARVRRWL